MDDPCVWREGDDLPVQDDRFPIGGMNPGLDSIPPIRALRLIANWRQLCADIGPHLEGAMVEQCANQLEALLYGDKERWRGEDVEWGEIERGPR